MPYEEFSIYAIQKEWQQSFIERYRLFTTMEERDHTFQVLLGNQDPIRNKQMHPVILKIIVKRDKDAEQMKLDFLNDS